MKQIILFCGIILTVHLAPAQLQRQNLQEHVYLHVSTTDLIVGESINYAAYVTSLENGKLSDLSKILYVELLDENGRAVYQTKLKLNKGKGYGALFMHSELATGAYHLVAYTRWMKNFGTYFSQPLLIINPYQPLVKPSDAIEKIAVEFFPEGGNLIEGVNQKMVIKCGNCSDVISTRVVADDGTRVADVVLDKNGYGAFSLISEPGKNYQVIMETALGFEFFDVPVPCTGCIGTKVTDVANAYGISILTNAEGQATIEIWNEQNMLLKRTVATNTIANILKSELPGGPLRVVAKLGDMTSERIIFNTALVVDCEDTKSVYVRGEEVKLQMDAVTGGRYSVSVSRANDQDNTVYYQLGYKINAVIEQPQISHFYANAGSTNLDHFLITSKWKKNLNNEVSITFIPESRRDLIAGLILGKNGASVDDIPVAFASPGADYELNVTRTDTIGRFYWELDPINHSEAYAMVLFDTANDYDIEIQNEFYENYTSLVAVDPLFDSARISALIARSVQNQLMNAYYVDENSADSLPFRVPQVIGFSSYRLDDYTRFRTIRDTFIELMPEVSMTKNLKKYEFEMIGEFVDRSPGAKRRTLLLLDGVPISARDILEFSPYLIDRIDILNRQYFLGGTMVNGIILFNTYKNNLEDHVPDGEKLELVDFQSERDFAPPTLPVKPKPRQPDYRQVVFWHPNIVASADKIDLAFFTSEVPGKYEVRLEGVDQEGKPVTSIRYFEVK